MRAQPVSEERLHCRFLSGYFRRSSWQRAGRHLLPQLKGGYLMRTCSYRNSGFLFVAWFHSFSLCVHLLMCRSCSLYPLLAHGIVGLIMMPAVTQTDVTFQQLPLPQLTRQAQLPHPQIPKNTRMASALLSCAGPHTWWAGCWPALRRASVSLGSVVCGQRVRVTWICHSPAWASD